MSCCDQGNSVFGEAVKDIRSTLQLLLSEDTLVNDLKDGDDHSDWDIENAFKVRDCLPWVLAIGPEVFKLCILCTSLFLLIDLEFIFGTMKNAIWLLTDQVSFLNFINESEVINKDGFFMNYFLA